MTGVGPGRLALLAGLALGHCHSRFDIRRDVPEAILMHTGAIGFQIPDSQGGCKGGNIRRGDNDNGDKGPSP